MEVKPRIRRWLCGYECEGDGTWMSGDTIEESYVNWLKLWKNTQRLKAIHAKAVVKFNNPD